MPTKPKKSPNGTRSPQKLRIIGGAWRGRLLDFDDIEGLRPTGDRVRETVFNWLMSMVPHSHCLDLFSGSGALGFEALSRGAESATLVEKNASAARQLQLNATRLGAHSARIHQTDALVFLQSDKKQAYDLVFIDPPFAANLWQATIDLLAKPGWLAENACIYIESPNQPSYTTPPHWQQIKHKKAGQVTFCLYQIETNHEPTR